MDIIQIMNELIQQSILPANTEVLKKLQGGTVSELFLLEAKGKRYVIKSNEPSVLESEAVYLEFYQKINILPKLLYQDPANRFIVISFKDGDVLKMVPGKRAILSSVVNDLINQYKEVSVKEGWGWKDEPVSSWKRFVLLRAEEANQTLSGRLEQQDFERVVKLINKSEVYRKQNPSLLHGDCGIHNFLISEGNLSGIIDPSPVIGPPLYDLLYAFCSSPEDLTSDTLLYCANQMKSLGNIQDQELFAEVLIFLFIRMATCIKHHSQDIVEYERAWGYWKTKVHVK